MGGGGKEPDAISCARREGSIPLRGGIGGPPPFGGGLWHAKPQIAVQKAPPNEGKK